MALLAFAAAAASCGGKVVSAEDDSEVIAGEHDAGAPVGSVSPPPSNAQDAGPTSVSDLEDVAVNCGSANVVYADVLDMTATNPPIMGGERLFPVRYAFSSGMGTSTYYVELSTITTGGPNFIAVTVGGMSDNAVPLATMTYAEPPDDSGPEPFLDIVIDGEDLTLPSETPTGSFAVTAPASSSPDGVLLPFSLAFDVTMTSRNGATHVVGCAHWGG
jgi:hypothetical protein